MATFYDTHRVLQYGTKTAEKAVGTDEVLIGLCKNDVFATAIDLSNREESDRLMKTMGFSLIDFYRMPKLAAEAAMCKRGKNGETNSIGLIPVNKLERLLESQK